MSLKKFLKLEKLQIEAYEKVDRSRPALASMELMFNPTGYKEQHSITYQKKCLQGINSSGKSAKYSYTPPGDLAFKFILDGTGVSYSGAQGITRAIMGESVNKQIADFKKLCLEMDGNIHEPSFLIVRWGDFKFPCRLKTLDITFKLFDESGDPIRAELDVVFVTDERRETINRRAGKNSPDLTHVRTVKSGDTLPFMCKQIYGSSKHYLFIAQANDLNDFRNLVPGQEIRFPPLPKKQENR